MENKSCLNAQVKRWSRAWLRRITGHPKDILVILIILLHGISAFASPLVDISLHDEQYREVYDFLDRMIAKKAISGVLKNTRPFSRGEVANALEALDKKVISEVTDAYRLTGDVSLSKIEQKRLAHLMRIFAVDLTDSYSQQINANFREYLLQTQGESHRFGLSVESGETVVSRNQTDMDNETGYVTLLRPIVTGQVKDDFAFYTDLKFYYLTGAIFPDVPKTEGRLRQPGLESSTAALTVSYGKFKLPWFELLFGKENLSWGPGRHGALLISDNPPPMSMMKLSAWYNNIKFHAFTSMLDSSVGNKYLSAHRLEFSLWDKVSLGISESIVYGDSFVAPYVNPFQIYTATDMSERVVNGEKIMSPDNVLISGDLDLLLVRNLEFYGELLIDDFYPNYGLRSPFHWISKWGIMLGSYYVDAFSLPDTELRIEYTFINQYTYTHDPILTTYTHFDSVIGHQIGADADNLWINVQHWLTDKARLSMSYELERHGEGDVNKPHPREPFVSEEWEFLSGVTESTNSLSLGLSYATIGRYFADLKYTVSWIKNISNKINENSTRHQFILKGSYRF